MTQATTISPTRFQARVLSFRGRFHIANLGGRGSGKSRAMLFDALEHLKDPDAKALVLRESVAGLYELQDELHDLAVVAFGTRVTRNRQAATLRMPHGSSAQFACVSDQDTYAKLQGTSVTGLYVDELGNYRPEGYALFRRTLSNLRAAPGREVRCHITANPHGRSHARVLREFVRGKPMWEPWRDEHGELWVTCTSTFRDNPHLDQQSYERRLHASCGGDRGLARAWLEGDWNTVGGALLAPPFDERVHVLAHDRIPLLDPQRYPGRWRLIIGADWGTASPCAALLMGQLREPVKGFPFLSGDLFALDETDTAIDQNDLGTGSGASVPAWAEMVKSMLERNGLRGTQVVQDDARGLAGDTVCQEMRRCGVSARRPYAKDRAGGWTMLRTLLQSAVERDGRPGLWVSERCPHLCETLPEGPRSPLRPEDLDPKWNADHWLDSARYAAQELHGRGTTLVVKHGYL